MRLALAVAIAAAAVPIVAAPPAIAESCTGVTASGGRFATCFDLGNRLSITAGSDGFGGAISLRHEVTFEDDPDLVWKLEHTFAEATHAGFEDRFTGVLYRGRYLRHARDGHIVIPIGQPKKVFLPFDVGALTEVGRIEWRPGSTEVRIGVVRTAALIDLARTRTFRRRFSIGPSARWDVDADRDEMTLTEHVVAPFTTGLVNVHLESATGRMLADFAVEAGAAWRSTGGWHPDARAEAVLERIVLAIDDRPIALTFGVRYDTVTDETLARVGARIVLVHRRDPRVVLDPLHAQHATARR